MILELKKKNKGNSLSLQIYTKYKFHQTYNQKKVLLLRVLKNQSEHIPNNQKDRNVIKNRGFLIHNKQKIL